VKVLRRRPGGPRDAGPPPPGAGPGTPGAGPSVPGLDPMAERGRGRRRLALLVPAATVALGLLAGGLPVGRLVATSRPEPAARPARGGSAAQAGDPMAQLRDAGVVLFTDQQGRAFRQGADGRGRQALGQLKELAAQPSQPTFDPGNVAAGLLAAPADHRHAELAPDGDLAYLRQADGAAAVGRLRDGSVRRLVAAGWRSPTLPHHSADGAVVGACGYRLGGGGPGRNLPGVQAARSWILDGSGRELAALPGCLYDVADDGSAALVADPAQGRAAGPVPDAGFQELPVMQGSDQLTRGLRLWRRDGGFRPVLSFAEVVRTFRAVQPGADRRGLVVVTAVLGPDLRQALVRIVDVLATQDPRTGREGEVLALVDLERGRAEPVPEHLPGLMAWLPTGGYAYSGNAGLATYVARRQPPALLAATLAQEGTNVLAPSPDGAWLLLAGSTWRFVRVDDPAVQVAYRAPGRFAGWAPPAEPAAREGGP
jgi:hypothetical protein